ncbi:MAG: hypothetical protein K0M78_14845 [Brevundimonas sp.]|nr:hypothetical protein [Brevundimonas sp.]
MLLTVVFGERSDLGSLASQGALWAEDLPANRTQIEAIWKAGQAATLFKSKDLHDVLFDADLHEPGWRELKVLRNDA